MGAVTGRLHIICLPVVLAVMNETLWAVDPTSNGPPVGVPLRVAGDGSSTTVAYGASWGFEDVTAQELRRAFHDAEWSPRPRPAERFVYGPGSDVPDLVSGQRFWLWDGQAVTFPQCLSALSLDFPVRG